jgi:hypothetical protein
MRMLRPAVVLTLAVIALAYGAAPSEATHLGFKDCRNTTTRTVRTTHVKSNFGCRSARATLRVLLRHGVHGLPKPTKRVGRWGCTRTGFKHFYVCERRYSSPAVSPASVVFQAHAR